MGITEISNTKITSWNTTLGDVESLPSATWKRSAVYATGTSSKMNISNSNLSYLGYNLALWYGVDYSASSSGNVIINSSFLQNYIGLRFKTSSNNNTITDSTISTVDLVTGNRGFSIESRDNILINNTVSAYDSGAIIIGTSGYNNIIINCTASSNTGPAINMFNTKNNIITGGSYSSVSGYVYQIINVTNETFNNTNFTVPRTIQIRDNTSIFEYDDGKGIWLKTQIIVSPTAWSNTTRAILSWTQANTSWSETWTEARQIQYNISGLLPSRTYQVYNGTNIDYTYVTNATGVLTSFTINFTTDTKVISVLLTSVITIPANSWGVFNNWSYNTNFSSIAANESNDVA
ncbi:MAG: right-handed parallel beta-helix repeat-containing protein, partial [Alphaproteobacteria bacterium]|nr:right-handed parallel beta-helix repeat-containing protein [Alphaproteobacteria bacterium]